MFSFEWGVENYFTAAFNIVQYRKFVLIDLIKEILMCLLPITFNGISITDFAFTILLPNGTKTIIFPHKRTDIAQSQLIHIVQCVSLNTTIAVIFEI